MYYVYHFTSFKILNFTNKDDQVSNKICFFAMQKKLFSQAISLTLGSPFQFDNGVFFSFYSNPFSHAC